MSRSRNPTPSDLAQILHTWPKTETFENVGTPRSPPPPWGSFAKFNFKNLRGIRTHMERVLDKKCDDPIRHLFCRSVSPLKLTNIVIFCYDTRSIFCVMGTGLRKRQHSLEGLVNLITRGFSKSLITNALSATTSVVRGAQGGGYQRHPQWF